MHDINLMIKVTELVTLAQKGINIPITAIPLFEILFHCSFNILSISTFSEFIITDFSFVLIIHYLFSFFHFVFFHLELLFQLDF